LPTRGEISGFAVFIIDVLTAFDYNHQEIRCLLEIFATEILPPPAKNSTTAPLKTVISRHLLSHLQQRPPLEQTIAS
jgi:hypothetical protein